MIDRNIEREKLFRAFFEDKDFSKEQLDKAKESVRNQRLNKKQNEKLQSIREYQYRLNLRRHELLSKALGTNIISDDEEIKELSNKLNRSYKDFKKESDEYELSLNDCPKLPHLDDFMSRIHPDLDNDFPPFFYTYNDTEISGTDDNLHNSDDPDTAIANANESSFKVAAHSINDHPISVNLPVKARASLIFPITTRYPIHYSDFIVKAHLYGAFEGSQFDGGFIGGPTHIRAWVKMSLMVWDGYWIPEDSVKINLMEEEGGLFNSSSIQRTTFQRTLELSSNNIYGRIPPVYQVSITAGVEALAPPNLDSILFGMEEINTASAALDMVLCAVDIGYKRRTISLTKDRYKVPAFRLEF